MHFSTFHLLIHETRTLHISEISFFDRMGLTCNNGVRMDMERGDLGFLAISELAFTWSFVAFS